jgi:hypothetical protein
VRDYEVSSSDHAVDDHAVDDQYEFLIYHGVIVPYL